METAYGFRFFKLNHIAPINHAPQILKTEFTLSIRTSDLEPGHCWEENNAKRFKNVFHDFPIEEELSNPETQSAPYMEISNDTTLTSIGINFEKENGLIYYYLSVDFRDRQRLPDSDEIKFRVTSTTTTFKTSNPNFVEYLMQVFFDNNPSELNELLRHTSENKLYEGIGVETVKYLSRGEFFGPSNES